FYFHNLQRVDDYADLMNISRISLNKVVKHQFNVTATEFIKSRLLFEVKMNLIHTDKTVAEIANLFNFSEANHLTRFFKQKTGLSPIKFRQANSV
ncbi:helix-turn-helix domain-containing protein, partial [Crocinitomix algicola]|uniref:helix-turn-helix domain-containing protein n=1 Tax=Crocinitomix algicola TaxID=1740263 RepID=UPI001112D95B